MKLFAVHDSEGKILEMVMCPADGPEPILETPSGVLLTEIDPPEGLAEDTDLRAFAKTHRVAANPPRWRSAVVPLDE